MQEESNIPTRKLSWSWLTRVLHLLIALAVVHQLGVSLIMVVPEAGKPGNIYYEFHESVGLASFGIVLAYWIWLALRRTDRGAGALFPWFSSPGRGAVLADLRAHLISLGRLRLPALEEQPLASAVHGLGLLTATIMAGTGMLAWSGSLSETNAERLWQVHMLVGNLMWAYLIGHVSVAVLHELAGERLLGRMFTLRTKGS